MLHLSDQVNATTIDGVTPLFNACSAGSATCTEVLLENGAKPQSEMCQPSPIHEASSKGTCRRTAIAGYVCHTVTLLCGFEILWL